ncbi:MAG TPA: cupin domain-containing protein [Polyangiaceae bacterium]|jgi:cupin 2 domain-containing protein|nr:cupin domain-containing protein [Polyangiaceae bacterium]
MRARNLEDGILPPAAEEQLTELVRRGPVRIERIVSHGHCSAPGFWYDQAENEWVLVVRGAARLEYDGGETLALNAGDCVEIPSHQRHRVAWTDPERQTVWLAVFWR